MFWIKSSKKARSGPKRQWGGRSQREGGERGLTCKKTSDLPGDQSGINTSRKVGRGDRSEGLGRTYLSRRQPHRLAGGEKLVLSSEDRIMRWPERLVRMLPDPPFVAKRDGITKKKNFGRLEQSTRRKLEKIGAGEWRNFRSEKGEAGTENMHMWQTYRGGA